MNSLLEKALKVAANTVFVKEYASDEEAERRMSICKTCPLFLEDSVQCGVCGCFMDVKTKSAVNRNAKRPFGEVTHCPKGKWGDLETANYYRAIDGLTLLK